MKNKKGISAIVATVLIILITVAAVTIIWAAIIPMISNELGGATECFDASAALAVLAEYSCYNTTSVDIQISRTSGDFVLLGMNIAGSYLGTSETVEIAKDDVPNANGARVYTIGLDGDAGADGNFTLTAIDSASVSARVKSGQTEKLCDGSAVVSIVECAA